MGFSSTFKISGSALTAQRLRMDVVAGNIANVNTTRSSDGGPYRRRQVVFSPYAVGGEGQVGLTRGAASSEGIRVARIVEQERVKLVNDPSHPDADQDGNVAYPDIDMVQEMVDMMSAVRAYEASVTAVNAAKGMALKALEMGR